MKKQLATILILGSYQLIGQNSNPDSHPVQYEVGNSIVVNCSTCNSEIGHIKYHQFKNSTETYFQVKNKAVIEENGNHLCSVCRTPLFKEDSLILTSSRWNVFKQAENENILIRKVTANDWDSHVEQCIICQKNEHYAPGLHFDMNSGKKKKSKN